MKDILLSVPAESTFQVSSKDELQVNHATQLVSQAYLPGVRWLEQSGKIKPNFKVEYSQSNIPKLEVERDHITINDDWNGRISLDLWHLLYSLSRVHFLGKNLYSVHSASVGSDSHSLLIGHSGVGKTSVMLRMVRDYDWKVFSGNKTVISFDGVSNMEAIAGTKSITTRTADVPRHSNLPTAQTKYDYLSAHLLESDKYEHKSTVPLKAIFLPRLNDGVSEIEQVSGLSAVHLLYPYFMDTISADTIMCGGRFVYIGKPPKGCEERLSTQLTKVLQDVPVYKVGGSMSFVSKTIADLYQKS